MLASLVIFLYICIKKNIMPILTPQHKFLQRRLAVFNRYLKEKKLLCLRLLITHKLNSSLCGYAHTFRRYEFDDEFVNLIMHLYNYNIIK